MRKEIWLASTFMIVSVAACATQVRNGSGGAGGGTDNGGGGATSGEVGGNPEGGSTPTPTGGGGAGANDGGGSGIFVGQGGARPPSAGSPQAGDGSGAVFAISKLFLGDTNLAGQPDPQGWKQFGYNIDGQVTNCSGNACNQVHDHCRPRDGGSRAIVYPDGDNGIDNSFGANILPVLTAIQMDTSHENNLAIASGKWTVIFDVQHLGSGSSYDPLASLAYVGADLGHVAKFDGTDVWPVRPEWLSDPSDVTTSMLNFPMSYVVNDTWVSWYGGHLEVPLEFGGATLTLDIGAALATFQLSADHGKATGGKISGVLEVEQFVDAFAAAAGQIDPSLCSGSTLDSIKHQMRQAADIMSNGAPGNSGIVCDGISIGLGFNASRIQLGGVGAPIPPNDPCN